MDRTAIAAIIIGFGATAAAMVMPQKYPSAPKWAIELSWWGGVFLIVAGTIYLVTEFTLNDLGSAALASVRWISGHLAALARSPITWVIVAFAAGMAVTRWGPSVWKVFPAIRPAPSLVMEWLTPFQAADRFVAPQLLSDDRVAVAQARMAQEKVDLLQATLERMDSADQAVSIREQWESAINERDAADYVAKRRRTDITECLRQLLRTEKLVAKGCQVKEKKGKIITEPEAYMPKFFWSIAIRDVDCLDLINGVAQGGYPHQVFRDVMIGKSETATN